MTTRINLAFVDNFRQTAQMMIDQGLHHGYFYTSDNACVEAFDCSRHASPYIPYEKHLVTRQSYHKFECHYQGTTYELEL